MLLKTKAFSCHRTMVSVLLSFVLVMQQQKEQGLVDAAAVETQNTKNVNAAGWLVQDFPNPTTTTTTTKTTQQGSSSPWVSDPDHILHAESRQSLVEKIQVLQEHLSVRVQEEDVPLQFAVVIIEKMNLASHGLGLEEDVAVAAAGFAQTLHDTWGVGHVVSSTGKGTGVLVFLSVHDRIMYISRGGALDAILTNSRIDTILDNAQSPFRQAKYAQGLSQVLDEIADYIQRGEPSWKEWLLDFCRIEYFFLVGWLGLLFKGLTDAARRRREQRLYVAAASQLSELDRQQAQALQGQYEAKSCPICLEDFQSSTVGSDGQPIKLLRCGHVFDECCWSEWVSTGQGNVAICPICKKDVGAPPPSAQRPSSIANSSITTVDGAVDTGTDSNDSSSEVESLVHQQRQLQRTTMMVVEEEQQAAIFQQQHQQDRAIQRYQQERNFRLLRLAHRFPQYVTQNQLQQWTSPTFRGSLVRDPSFTQNNPQRVYEEQQARRMGQQQQNSHGRHSGFHTTSFGGGTSSGGRAGRF